MTTKKKPQSHNEQLKTNRDPCLPYTEVALCSYKSILKIWNKGSVADKIAVATNLDKLHGKQQKNCNAVLSALGNELLSQVGFVCVCQRDGPQEYCRT